MEKNKQKRAANAKLLSDELDKIPVKQAAQPKTLLKRQPKSLTSINFKSASKQVVQQKKIVAVIKEETILSDKSTALSEITPKSSEKSLPRKPIAPLSKMGG